MIYTNVTQIIGQYKFGCDICRYKETIQSLQNDLIDVRHPDRLNDADKLLSDSTPSPIRRVTISETPPRVHGYGKLCF